MALRASPSFPRFCALAENGLAILDKSAPELKYVIVDWIVPYIVTERQFAVAECGINAILGQSTGWVLCFVSMSRLL